jgi:hypothetical protein
VLKGILQIVGEIFRRLRTAGGFTHHSPQRFVISTRRARSSSMICIIRDGIRSPVIVSICARIGRTGPN